MNSKTLILAAAAALAACGSAQAERGTGEMGWKASSYGYGKDQVIGSGRMVSENRAIGSFERLAIDGPVDVVIRQGSARSLTLYAEDNIIGLVRARTEGGKLSLSTMGAFRTREGIRAVLTVPALEEAAINSSGDIQFEDWSARAAKLVIGGSGDIRLAGDVEDVRALIGGSGEIDLTATRMRNVDADIEGSGVIRVPDVARLDATINGSGQILAEDVGELDAVLNGSGEILYRSADRVLREERNGSGRIRRR